LLFLNDLQDDWEKAIGQVVCGDAIELMKIVPDKAIDLVLTDPPFGHNNNNNDLIRRREAALGRGKAEDNAPRPIANDGIEANELYRDMLKEYHRTLKSGCCCCCCCCGGGGPDPQFARWSLWMDEIFDFKQMVVWDKGKIGMGWHYRRSYETILVGTKQGAACKWYDDTKQVENIIRHIGKIIPQKNNHPTEKPLELMKHFIQLHTQQNDIVLDCFSGHFTTALAAEQLGRRWIACDISPQYAEIGEKRLQQFRAQGKLW
jgi:DNA modification methylase